MRRRTFAIVCVLLLSGCRAPRADVGGASGPKPELPGTGVLVVRNPSERVVFHVRLRHEGETAWSGDRLAEGDVIKPGQERRLELPVGRYRVFLEFGDGGDWESATCDVRAGDAVACDVPTERAPVREGTIKVSNATPWAISAVRFSDASEMSFGPNRLEGGMIAAGGSQVWSVPVGSYQLQVTFQDGTQRESPPSRVEPGKETVFRVAE